MTSRRQRMVQAHYKKAVKLFKDNNNIDIALHPENMEIWYVKIHSLDKPLESGEFLFQIELADNFPFDPPSLITLTPNGSTESGKNCISIGEFHKQNYPAALATAGFIEQLLSVLIGLEQGSTGIRIVNNSDDQIKQNYANQSKEYNQRNYSEILSYF